MDGSGVASLFPSGTRIIRIFTAPELASGAAALPGWDEPGMRLCKLRSRGRATVGRGVFLKEYVYRSRFECWRRKFMVPRPFIALAAEHRLEALGVPTPRVLAAARGVSPDGTLRDLLVTEELPGGVRFGNSPEMTAEALSEALPAVMFQLHEGGFFHGDLSLRNWYLGADGKWGLIDLDGTELFRWRVTKLRRTRELARLASSCFMTIPPEKMDRRKLSDMGRRFLDRYAAAGGSVYEKFFFRRTLALVNRSRRKYLNLGDI